MRILFIAPTTLDLYKPILDQLQKSGFDTVFKQDILLPLDYKQKERNILKRSLYYFLSGLTNKTNRYWKKKINIDSDYSKSYDLLFCIQGTSINKFLINHLQRFNPSIRTSIYFWDSSRYYDFFRIAKYFTKVYTFDYQDSLDYPGTQYLPFYWCQHAETFTKIKYHISIVGSDHDGRFELVEKIVPQLKVNNATYFLKIYLPIIKRQSDLLGFVFRWHYSNLYNKAIERREHQLSTEFVITNQISPVEAMNIIMESNCILDTDRELQTGSTPRVIWALAAGKKIVTTNKSIVKLPIYNEKEILIIDRDNPIIDIDFVKNVETFTPSLYIQNLRIDKWVLRFVN